MNESKQPVVVKEKNDRTTVIEYYGDVYSFDEVNHVHTLNGKNLRGVTTTIDKTLPKPALMPWAVKTTVEWIEGNCPLIEDTYRVTKKDLLLAKKAHTQKKTDAGDWGTRVHNACEDWCRYGTITDELDIRPSVLNFVDFIQTNGFKVLDVERNVWSKTWWIGGIFDLVLEKDGKVYIADIKTSSGIYDSHLIQMGAYYKCLQELDWIKDYGVSEFSGSIVINLKKDNTIQHCTTTALPMLVDMYGTLVTMAQYRETIDTISKAVTKGVSFTPVI